MLDNEQPTTAAETKPSLTVDQLRTQLAAFLAANPSSAIEEVANSAAKRLAIKKPWGDDSLVIFVPDDVEAFAEALNNVHLPARYTAIWHRDTKDLEVIWTAHPLPPDYADLLTRKFFFQYNAHEYRCEFLRSSERLLVIAANSRPVSGTSTNYRNLQSFYAYMSQKAPSDTPSKEPRPSVGEPLSFWIRSVEWDEDEVLGLVNHLNFYMTYYDTISPSIVIHSPKSETQAAQPRTRYMIGRFPERIAAAEVDDTLLHFWNASRLGDPAWRFLQCFRIIEYASFSFLEAGVRASVRRILSAPHALDDMQGVTERVLAAIARSKLDDYLKFEAILKERVEPAVLWREINRNLSAFTTETKFDGGFTVTRLISNGAKEEEFTVNGIGTFTKIIRDIRNGLSHGKELKSSAAITPTARNFERLQPWASLISVAAGEVLLNRDPP